MQGGRVRGDLCSRAARLYGNCGCEVCVLPLDLLKDFRHELAVFGELVQAFDEMLDFTFFSSHLVFLHCLDMHRHVMADDVKDDFSKCAGYSENEILGFGFCRLCGL